MTSRSIAALLLLAVAAAPAAAAPPRAPTGKWFVNSAHSQCVASREYGAPGKSLRLMLKAPPLGDVLQVAVRREAAPSRAALGRVLVAVDGGRTTETDLLMYDAAGVRERIFLMNLPSADLASMRTAKTLSMRSTSLSETFALSGMEAMLKVVDSCVAELRRLYNAGANRDDPTRFKQRARGNIARLFSSRDYPAVALRNGQGGRVQYALLVDEDGRVADCTIVATSGVAVLDSQACAVLKSRAKFEPAIGVDDKPAKDSLIGSIYWRIP